MSNTIKPIDWKLIIKVIITLATGILGLISQSEPSSDNNQ